MKRGFGVCVCLLCVLCVCARPHSLRGDEGRREGLVRVSVYCVYMCVVCIVCVCVCVPRSTAYEGREQRGFGVCARRVTAQPHGLSGEEGSLVCACVCACARLLPLLLCILCVVCTVCVVYVCVVCVTRALRVSRAVPGSIGYVHACTSSWSRHSLTLTNTHKHT